MSHALSIPHTELKVIGPAFGTFTNFSRRFPIHRAATLGPKSNLQQVIIKNTEAQKYSQSSIAGGSVVRSQSHMSSNHIPTVAPRRSERIKLENALSDVWTKSVLPYPGMGTRRTENTIRASANSVMRKLSMVSIASSFSKRSLSYSTLSFQKPGTTASTEPRVSIGAATEDGYASSSGTSSRTFRPKKASEKHQRPVLVDFHTAPSAFLPEDFELNIKPGTNLSRRSRKLAARLSMSADAPEVSSVRPMSSGSMKTVNMARPVVIRTTDTIRSMVALTMDGTADESEDGWMQNHSGEKKSHESQAISSPPTPFEGTSMRKMAKARKGLLRFFI